MMSIFSNSFKRKLFDNLLILALLLSIRTSTGAPSITSINSGNRVQEPRISTVSLLDHNRTDLVSYRPRDLIADRQAEPFDDVVTKFFDWQTIQSSPEAIAAMSAAYTEILNFVSNLDSNLAESRTKLLFSYGSISITIITGDLISKRSAAMIFPSPRDILHELLIMLDDFAMKGLVGFYRVVCFVGKLAVLAVTVGTLWGIAPRRQDVLAGNLII
ncbi:MAG: hypothetical protein Q9191_005479 [Dirinaria sp. TL-2023a]